MEKNNNSDENIISLKCDSNGIKKIIKIKDNIIYKIIELDKEGLNYKPIFRELRTLKAIENKSEYLIQLRGKKLIHNKNNKLELHLEFNDEGIDLQSLINFKNYNYRQEPNLIKSILFQLLKGVDTLHSLNIIHRNLSPSHILISETGAIKIIGFSKSINDIESKFVEDKIVGELHYTPPECLINQCYNNKYDMFSIGILMLELYSKKTGLLKLTPDSEKESLPLKCFRQLKSYSDFFKVKFNFRYSETNEQKAELEAWISKVEFDEDKFNGIFQNIPDLDESGLELLRKLLEFNPKKRIKAKEALKMKYFEEFQDLNKEENSKKNKTKFINEDFSVFVRNLEKEYQKVNECPLKEKMKIFQDEINNFCKI